jgi:RNA polymerase sigma factor (sigma-70 family)
MHPTDPRSPAKPSTEAKPPEPSADLYSPRPGCATVVVRQPPPAPPKPKPADPGPRVVIRPRTHANDGIVAQFIKEHGAFVVGLLHARQDVVPESKKDLRQLVLLVLTAYVDKHGRAPEKPRAWLRGVVRNEVRAHKRLARARMNVDRDADLEAVATSAPGPERARQLVEQTEKLEQYLARLPEDEAEVVHSHEQLEMTLEEIAAELGIPVGSVATILARGRKNLRELAEASAREAELRLLRSRG